PACLPSILPGAAHGLLGIPAVLPGYHTPLLALVAAVIVAGASGRARCGGRVLAAGPRNRGWRGCIGGGLSSRGAELSQRRSIAGSAWDSVRAAGTRSESR